MKAYGTVQKILETAYGKQIAEKLLSAYVEIESNYSLGKWKASELDAGHFVESVRRILEQELFGSHTSFSKKLKAFDDSVLKNYEQATGHDESYRMLIPRTLKAIYNIRNKRGVGHITGVSPNEMDSTYILYTVKWILAELVRLNSSLSVQETQRLVDNIVERKVGLIWKTSEFTRILYPDMNTRDKVLVLLYDESPRSVEELQGVVEYKNKSDFTKLLRRLHKDALIHFGEDKHCTISPTGIIKAEQIILNTEDTP